MVLTGQANDHFATKAVHLRNTSIKGKATPFPCMGLNALGLLANETFIWPPDFYRRLLTKRDASGRFEKAVDPTG